MGNSEVVCKEKNYDFFVPLDPDNKGKYFVGKKLPVKIIPKPEHFYRIHLLLTPVSRVEALKAKILTQEPEITPLSRKGFTVVEIGAATVER